MLTLMHILIIFIYRGPDQLPVLHFIDLFALLFEPSVRTYLNLFSVNFLFKFTFYFLDLFTIRFILHILRMCHVLIYKIVMLLLAKHSLATARRPTSNCSAKTQVQYQDILCID